MAQVPTTAAEEHTWRGMTEGERKMHLDLMTAGITVPNLYGLELARIATFLEKRLAARFDERLAELSKGRRR